MSSSDTNRFADALLDHFRERPGARAASFVTAAGRVDLGFADIERDCRRFAAAYRNAGVGQGGTVLIFLRHVPELYGSFFGAMLAGHVPSLMPCTSPRQDSGLYWRSHDKLLRRIRPDAIVASDETFAEMQEAGLDLAAIHQISIDNLAADEGGAALAPPPGEHIALLQHSSGTTGLKKGVRLSFDAIRAQVDSYAGVLSLDDEDRIVSWLPLYHDMGLIACMITPAYLGIPVTHIDPFHWLSRPGLLLDLLDKERGTFCWLPNFAFEHLTLTAGRDAASYELGRVRAFINCSEPCRASTFHRFAEAFAAAGVNKNQLQCCYAMAETVFAVSQTPLGQAPRVLTVDGQLMRTEGRVADTAPGAPEALEVIESGQVIPGLRVEIRDEGRRPLPERHVGEIAIAGEFLFDGYNADPERTAARLENGFYHSGDLGFLADGRLYVLGRTDDLMIVNGRNIYGHEVEAEIAGIDGLKPGRAVVLAHEDTRIGSQVMIVIAERVERSARSSREIQREIIDRIFSIFQITPRYVELVEEGWLIKTTSGKIGRSANLAKFLEARNQQG
ncbi:AMP-binding protein [Minwuia thermotolerans]|nr:AMP-binding protein [Minwuia thermotolerans]